MKVKSTNMHFGCNVSKKCQHYQDIATELKKAGVKQSNLDRYMRTVDTHTMPQEIAGIEISHEELIKDYLANIKNQIITNAANFIGQINKHY